MDPLSQVLSLLKLRTFTAGGLDGAGDWSIQFGPHQGIKCYALVSGFCWLAVEGVSEPVRAEAGDCFLLPRGLPFQVASRLNLPPVAAESLFRTELNGGIRTWNGGGEFMSVGGHFAFAGPHARMLLEELPPIVHLSSEQDKAEMRWSLERMRQELREQRPGGALVAQQLATSMLVQALRLYLGDGGWNGRAGWLAALTDKQIKAAVTGMHENPARRWTVKELAQCSGMSRSIFAERFKQTVGEAPMEYLTRWRMLLAGERLTASDDPVAVIALELGYDSESAFSKAFRRVMQRSPRQYRRGPDAREGPGTEGSRLIRDRTLPPRRPTAVAP